MHYPHYHFPTERTEIEAMIDAIDPIRYGKNRNYLIGAVTYLSPYISRGFVTLPEIRTRILARGYKPYQIEQFLKELAWREYFLRVWESLGTAGLMQDIRNPQEGVMSMGMPDAFVHATTGIEAIDEGIETLYETGYMHNHLRMYTAGIVCNMSGAHWRTPSKWLYYHLLDGDIASNTCSWQWNAGAFSSKKYITVQDNINQYTGSTQRGTFLDVDYEHIWDVSVPEHMKKCAPLTLTTTLPEKQAITLDPTKILCIYTDYSIDPDWMSDTRANRILVLSPSHFREFPVSEKVIEFIVSLATENIDGIQIYIGEIQDLIAEHKALGGREAYIVDHVLYRDIVGVTKTPYPYMIPEVSGYFPSFFGYWKRGEKYMMKG